MKTGWKILVIVGIFWAVFTVIWLMTMHIQPENAVEAYKKSLREQGEKLTINEVLPPPVATESNGVNLVESAFSLLSSSDDSSNQPPAMRMIAPGKALIGWQQPDLREVGVYGYTNSWANALADAESNRPAIELLQQAANYPAIDFQLDYHKDFETSWPYLMPFRNSIQQLSAAMMCDLHRTHAASATTNLCTLLSLVQAEHDERLLIPQSVRIAMANIAASMTWEWLQAANVTDGELSRVQNKWEQLEFVHAMENSMTMERAIQEDLLQKIRVSNSEFHRRVDGAPPAGWTSSGDWWQDAQDRLKTVRDEVGISIWRVNWSYADEMFALKYDQIALEAFRAIETNQPFLSACNDMSSLTAALDLTDPVSQNWFLRVSGMDQFQRMLSLYSSLPRDTLMHRVMAIESSKHIVITAIALKRYQLRRGNYPEKLSELTPELLPAVPLDPVDGKPLRYRRNTDGTFLLYSVGTNGTDDGGDPTSSATGDDSYSWINSRVRDWVWPQPATPAEIQLYYATPHK